MSYKKTLKLLSYAAALIGCVALAFAVLALGAVLDQPASADYSYTVKSGDSLTKIAAKQGVRLDALVAANKAKYPCLATNPTCLQIGWTVTIPSGDAQPGQETAGTYIVQNGDSLAKIAQAKNTTVQGLIDANKVTYSCLATSPTCLRAGWVLTIPAGSAARPVTQSTPVPVTAGNSDYWDLRQAVAAEINRVRAENGLPAYTWVDAIADIAQARSVDMVARGYYGHDDPVTGVSIGAIAMKNLGYRSNCEILNESWGTGYSEVATRSVKAWWNSAPHQKCMLANWLRRFGAGVAQDQEGVWYVTVLMGK